MKINIIEKIDKLLVDDDGSTTTGDIAVNTSGISPIIKRGISSIGYECPDGYEWDPKTRTCKKKVEESSFASAVAGSQQTRSIGDMNDITVIKRYPRPLKFNKLLGAYLPNEEEDDDEIIGEE